MSLRHFKIKLSWLACIWWLALFLCGVANPAFADQTAPELAELFAKLQNAASPAEAHAAEQAIWRTWMRGPTDDASARLLTARAAVQVGDFQQASKFFDALLKDFPEFAEAWNQRAIMRFLSGDLQGSLDDIASALALEPRHFGAWAGRGECYMGLDDLPAALSAYEAALALHPFLNSVEAKLNALRALYQRGA